MNKLRRIFTISVMVMTIVVMSGAIVPTVDAAAQAGDLIKMDGISAVYYLADDGKRYVFPNEATFMSWYSDFSGVVTVSSTELQGYAIGGNVVMRAGTKLVKITTDPTVYAVAPDGTLQSIVSEANAIDLYGSDWATMVVDVPDAFFTNYTVGSALTVGVYPAGQLLQVEGSSDVYYFDGTDYRMFSGEAAFLANGFSWGDVITTDMSFTGGGSDVAGFEAGLFDASQNATTGGGNVSTGTGLSVALSSLTPAATTVPTGATGVVATKFNVTASNDGDIVLDSLVIARSGLGDEAKIDKVYVYDGSTRLTSGRSISDSTQTATFSNINYTVAAGMTKTLSLVVDVTATSASGEHVLGIESASAIDAAGATVSGSFPVEGNIMSFSSTTIGEVDVEENNTGTVSGSTYDYTVYSGDTNVEIAKFNVVMGSVEDGLVESITLYNAGREVIENVELYKGSTVVATGNVSGDYITFDFDTPYEIEKSNSAQFMVMADIVDARDTDTVKLYVRYKTDVRVKGATYGYYVTVADGTSGSMVSPLDTTVQVAMTEINAGKVTMTSDGTPLTNNVAKNSNDVALLNFNITTQSAIDVEQVGIILTETVTTDALVSNLELVCDGSIVAEWANPVESNDYTHANALHTDTSVWSINANETISCQVRLDIASTASGDLVSYVDVSQWTFKDSATGDSIATADIIPSADITGNTMSIVSASVTATEAGIPAAQDWVAGDEFNSNGFNFAAGDAEDITVTSITVTGYYSATDANPTSTSSSMRDVVSSVELYVGDVKLGETKTLTTAGVAIFNTLNWDIVAGDTEKLVVKVTTAKGSVDGTDDTIKFAITAASAEYTSDGTSLDATITAVDTATEISVYQTITDSGSIVGVIDPSTPASDLVVMGNTDVVMSIVKFTATNEDFVVEKLQVTKAGSDDTAYSNVKVRYTDSNDVVQTAVGSFTANLANFSNLDIFVEKDESVTIEFLADLNTKSGGSTNDVTTSLSLTTSEFRAVAQGSGTVDTGGDVSTGNSMYVYESIPTIAFATDTPSGNLIPSANTLLAKIGITASAEKDITFDSTSTVAGIKTIVVDGTTELAGGEDPASANIVIPTSNGSTANIAVDIADGATYVETATAIAAAINAHADWAAVSGGTVTVTMTAASIGTWSNTAVVTTALVSALNTANAGDNGHTLAVGSTATGTAKDLLALQVALSRGDDATANDDSITIKDDEGTVLDTFTGQDFDDTTEFIFNFSSNSLTVAAGTTEYIYVYGTTTDFEDQGDSIQIWLDDVNADATFGIDGTGAYARGAIIFKGDLYGGSLVKP